MSWGSRVRAGLALLALGASLFGTSAASADVSATIFDRPRATQDWGYGPSTIRIAPGNWVTWSNDGQDAHTVTARDGSFDSGVLAPSEGFSWYFDTAGVYDYFCTLHEWMKGRVIVEDAGSAVSAEPAPPVLIEEPTATSDPSADGASTEGACDPACACCATPPDPSLPDAPVAVVPPSDMSAGDCE